MARVVSLAKHNPADLTIAPRLHLIQGPGQKMIPQLATDVSTKGGGSRIRLAARSTAVPLSSSISAVASRADSQVIPIFQVSAMMPDGQIAPAPVKVAGTAHPVVPLHS
jgi:hypothetical protein